VGNVLLPTVIIGKKEMTKEDFIKYQLVKQSKCNLSDFEKIDAKWECIDVDNSNTVTAHEVVAFMCVFFMFVFCLLSLFFLIVFISRLVHVSIILGCISFASVVVCGCHC
jgi:hypothetical protein